MYCIVYIIFLTIDLSGDVLSKVFTRLQGNSSNSSLHLYIFDHLSRVIALKKNEKNEKKF